MVELGALVGVAVMLVLSSRFSVAVLVVDRDGTSVAYLLELSGDGVQELNGLLGGVLKFLSADANWLESSRGSSGSRSTGDMGRTALLTSSSGEGGACSASIHPKTLH